MTTPNKITEEIELKHTSGLKAILEVEGGQCAPGDSDDIRVIARIYLPVSPNRNTPHTELQFGERVQLMNEPLTSIWGFRKEGSELREKYTVFTSSSYRQAMETAMEYLHDEINQLQKALDKRYEAFVYAENN